MLQSCMAACCHANVPPYLSLTEEQGSIISSLAATLATHPCVTLVKYTRGVLPMQ